MERRARLALVAAAIVLLAAVGAIAGLRLGPASGPDRPSSAATAQVSSASEHAERHAVPSVRLPSIRPADQRLDPLRLPWLVASAVAVLALLAATSANLRLRPAPVRVHRAPSGSAHRGRGPPRRV